ncbi:Ras-like protein family member 10B [Eumeta japonica]|uniref:Ras-like protein family member 10B n=1 Tax=Eumeta variegata TaxID=151549 RepID=A0A4C1YS62_EUMVA|nr:Ras-like protein family member 10B [Eumeta japonica]
MTDLRRYISTARRDGRGEEQFVWSDFSEEYVPTDRKHTFYPSVIINEHLYEVKITDIPVIPYFPINSYYEWAHYRFYGLRNATAYILVFDLSNVDTFQYIRTLRDQMVESRDMRNVPVLVVGNKQDLLCSNTLAAGGLQQLAIAESACGDIREKRRNIVNLVRKHWKCGYVECSAKYNWRVIAVFKELMEMIDALEWSGGGRSSDPPQDAGASGVGSRLARDEVCSCLAPSMRVKLTTHGTDVLHDGFIVFRICM